MNRDEIRKRAKELAARLTLDEKIDMIHGAQLFSTGGVKRLGIPPLVMSDGPMGVRQEFEPDRWIESGNNDDFVTCLPCNSALAATWNRELAEKTGSVLGAEARGRGKDVILAPGINIKRSPLCGRNFEYFSEDPYLTGELAAAFVRGVQEWDVAACVKHFAANNQETERLWVDVEVDERTLREIYLPAFYDCLVKGGSLTVMGAYNRLNGEHCCQSEYLLEKILREEWGYDGVVISDWGAVHDTEAAGRSQLDIEMSVTSDFSEYHMADPLKEAVKAGRVPENCVDEKAVRILSLMMRLHMLEGQERKRGTFNDPSHRKTALEAAGESIVLLKNEGSLLPLSADRCKRVLLIGDNARRIHSGEGGSAELRALYEITPLMGIKMALGGNAKVDFLTGYDAGGKKADDGRNWQEKSLESGEKAEQAEREEASEERRAALFSRAVSAAGDPDYDAVIFIGGLNHDYDSEGVDRSDMKLPYGQDGLIAAILAARPDAVVTLIGGSPVEMKEWIGAAQAVVWTYYNGMEGGVALAETLFGRRNPSGKLPETFYKTLEDCPAHRLGEFAKREKVVYGEGIFVGYRYQETFGVEPEFPFGHGLSYTDFTYLEAEYVEEEGKNFAVCKIVNAGKCAGAETVQAYWMRENGEVAAGAKRSGDGRKNSLPSRELAGFGKIRLEPGETGKLRFEVRKVPDGCRLGIGSSVKDIRLTLIPGE